MLEREGNKITYINTVGLFGLTGSCSVTVETLLDQLRTKQIEGMLNEQKKGVALKLPEKLAEASFEEAKKRALEGRLAIIIQKTCGRKGKNCRLP